MSQLRCMGTAMKALIGSLLGIGLSIVALAASLPYDDAGDSGIYDFFSKVVLAHRSR